MRYRWVLIAAVLVALLAAAGVAMAWQRTTGPPTGGPTNPGSARPSSSTLTSLSPSPEPQSAAERESANRAAIETAWNQFWDVYIGVESGRYPQAQWAQVVGAVAVDPTYSQVNAAAARFKEAGIAAYGNVVSRPMWPEAVGAKSTATMWDCMDQSGYGSLFVKTGQKRSVGVARDKTRATFVRGPDGRWRVKLIEYFVSQKC